MPFISKQTRRDFLATTSMVAVGTVAGARIGRALPSNAAESALTANELLPEQTSVADLRAFATSAVEAAKAAGASYADIRVSERSFLDLMYFFSPVMPDITLETTLDYGIRVLADGAWSFVHGTMPTMDTITAAARNAVGTARAYARTSKRSAEFGAAPAGSGEWETPHKVDPFTVPLQDHASLLGAYRAAASRVHNGGPGSTAVQWTRDTRVFASTEGAVQTQVLRRCHPRFSTIANVGLSNEGRGNVVLYLRDFSAVTGGYEAISRPGIQEEISELTHEAVRIAHMPRRSIDVGRYPIVLDGVSLGTTCGSTLGPALELDRVLGFEADASGTSYLAPPLDMLGTTITSPLLTVRAHRKAGTAEGVRWDDEGIEPDEYTVIEQGRLVDYHTSRETAAALAPWYAKQGRSVRSHGCMVAPRAEDSVLVRPPHTQIDAGAQRVTLDDLVGGVKRGLLLCSVGWVMSDQQLSSGSISGGALVLEIEKGKLVRRIENSGVQFNTAAFWKSLGALGDATTVRRSAFRNQKGLPWRATTQTVMAPAGLFKDVDVISTQVRL